MLISATMPGRASRGKDRSKAVSIITAARVRSKGLPAAARPSPVVERLFVAPAASIRCPAVDPYIALQGQDELYMDQQYQTTC